MFILHWFKYQFFFLKVFFFSVCDQYMGHHSAVKMLHSRVRLILDYVRAVQRGELGPADQASGHVILMISFDQISKSSTK